MPCKFYLPLNQTSKSESIVYKHWVYLLLLYAISIPGLIHAQKAPVDNNTTAILLYGALASTHPNVPEYFIELGQAYMEAGDWHKAVNTYKAAVKLQPHNPDLRVKLGYALLAQYQNPNITLSPKEQKLTLVNSLQEFNRVLNVYPDEADALEGLKRARKLLLHEKYKHHVQAKEEKPLPVTPTLAQDDIELIENTKLANLYTEQLAETEKRAKKTKWEKEELLAQTAVDLAKLGDHLGAIKIYLQLIEMSPKNAEYYYFLGIQYGKIEDNCNALQAFLDAITLKPDYTDARLAAANKYLFFKNYESALSEFSWVAALTPNEIEGWFGLARTEVLLNNLEYAESYFLIALEIAPENIELIRPYAALLLTQRRYDESLQYFRYLDALSDDHQINRATLFDTSAYVTPSFYAKGNYVKETEKDQFTHKWVASLQTSVGEAGIVYPINDSFRLTARGTYLEVKQRLLVSETTQFDALSFGGGIKGEWFYDPFWTCVADLRMEWISNNASDALLPTKRGTKVEPTLTFRYVKNGNTVYFGETTDSAIFRNFVNGYTRVFIRPAAIFGYQHDFGNQCLVGTDLAWLWYQDQIHNQEQDVITWIQAGVPHFEDLLTCRYVGEYRHMNHLTNGYYSFVYQFTQWLRARCYKTWTNGISCEINYWHGWRTTRGVNPQQQIIIGPAPLFPVITVEYQIDQAFFNLGYNPTDYTNFFVEGSYYHDSYDYTTYGIRAQWDWRF